MTPQVPWVVVVDAGIVVDAGNVVAAAEAVCVDAEGLPKEGVGLGTAPRGTG
jgi:hypothetical protein